MFIIVTVFMPKGIVGLPAQLRGVYRKRFAKKTAEEEMVAVSATESVNHAKTE
jgi:hypothetical protein